MRKENLKLVFDELYEKVCTYIMNKEKKRYFQKLTYLLLKNTLDR